MATGQAGTKKEREKVRKRGLIAAAFGFVGPIVWRAAQSYAAQYVENFITQQGGLGQLRRDGGAPDPRVRRPVQAAPGAGPNPNPYLRGRPAVSELDENPDRRKSPMIDRIQDATAKPGPAGGHPEGTVRTAAVARERLADSGKTIKDFTVKEPAKALGIALGMGVLLGWLIKRR